MGRLPGTVLERQGHAGLIQAPGTTEGQVEEMSSDLALRYSERATGIEPA